MNVLNQPVNQAETPSGRTGLTKILGGADTSSLQNTGRYQGPVRSSDNDFIKAVKEIQKVAFTTSDVDNVSRLLQITDLLLKVLREQDNKSLTYVQDLNVLIDVYNAKADQGEASLKGPVTGKEADLYIIRQQELVNSVNSLSYLFREKIKAALAEAGKKKKHLWVAVFLTFPLIGSLGIHQFYLGKWKGLLYLTFCWTFIPAVVSLLDFLKFLDMTEENFDIKYNPEYVFYKQFNC